MLGRLQFWARAGRGAGGGDPPARLDATRFVVLDTELTSLDHRSNRLLSIGAIAMDGGAIRLGQQFYRVVNPGVAVPASGILIHGLRAHDVALGEAPERVLEDLQVFLRGAVLVGHFVEIDLKVLRKELATGGHTLDNPAVDTARVHRWILRQGYSEDLADRLEDISLASLAKAYGLEFQEAHHALDDAFVTARLWQRFVPLLAERGVRDLKRLLRIAGV